MRYLLISLAFLTAFVASAKQVEFKLSAIDDSLGRVAEHAQDFPPKFSSVAERKQIEAELREDIKLLDAALLNYPDDTELLFRAGFANAMGHNLDFAGCAEKYFKAFDRLLELKPDDKRANFYYGGFLAATATRQKDSIRYLEKAISLGMSDAHYTLGFVYVSQREKTKGLQHFREYARQHPEDKNVLETIAQIESSEIIISHEPPPDLDQITKKEEPNKAPVPTPTAVTPPAGQEPRQP